MVRRSALREIALGLALAATACAATRPRPETVAAERRGDTAPDKRAALRAATPGLDLEAEDGRWGIEAAKERKHRPAARPDDPPTALPNTSGTPAIGVKAPPTP